MKQIAILCLLGILFSSCGPHRVKMQKRVQYAQSIELNRSLYSKVHPKDRIVIKLNRRLSPTEIKSIEQDWEPFSKVSFQKCEVQESATRFIFQPKAGSYGKVEIPIFAKGTYLCEIIR